jgi:hypothetical protein
MSTHFDSVLVEREKGLNAMGERKADIYKDTHEVN